MVIFLWGRLFRLILFPGFIPPFQNLFGFSSWALLVSVDILYVPFPSVASPNDAIPNNTSDFSIHGISAAPCLVSWGPRLSQNRSALEL